jgi:hypothetical protein
MIKIELLEKSHDRKRLELVLIHRLLYLWIKNS